MFIPDNINVAGINYAVYQQAHPPAGMTQGTWMGQCHSLNNEITINSELTPDRKLQTLFHEVAHAAVDEAGIHDLPNDEIVVSVISCALHSLHKQLGTYNAS